MIRKWIEAFGAAIELGLAEFRTGVTLVEAAAVDKFNVDLRMVTTSEEERQGVRDAALTLAKVGITSPEQVEEMASAWVRGLHREVSGD